jgi:hypothetical protein
MDHDPPPPEDPARGGDPSSIVVGGREPDPGPVPDQKWQPDPGQLDKWRSIYRTLARKTPPPKRENVLPFLLIRARSPGDRGQRPAWPPAPYWESPDILLVKASWTGPFDPAQLVVMPAAGNSYRVFVRTWNLGLLSAIGVHLMAWSVPPGFSEPGGQGHPAAQPTLIGGAMSDLDDRTRPGCQRVVEIDQIWPIPAGDTVFPGLIAAASCPADPWVGGRAPNADRHLGQRSLSLLAGDQLLEPLLSEFESALPEVFAVHVTHGGAAAGPLLTAIAGGQSLTAVVDGVPWTVPINPVTLQNLRPGVGVTVGQEQHLLTVVANEDEVLVASSKALADFAAMSGMPDPFADIPGIPQILLDMPAADFNAVGERINLAERIYRGPWPAYRLLTALRVALALDQLQAGKVAPILGGQATAQHLLRFTATGIGGDLLSGYSAVLLASDPDHR